MSMTIGGAGHECSTQSRGELSRAHATGAKRAKYHACMHTHKHWLAGWLALGVMFSDALCLHSLGSSCPVISCVALLSHRVIGHGPSMMYAGLLEGGGLYKLDLLSVISVLPRLSA